MNKNLLDKLTIGLVCLAGLTALPSRAGVVFGFEGTSMLDNCALNGCFRPPDTMGAVGVTQFLETSNGSITVYDKTNGAVQSRVGMVAFWANAGLPGGAGGDQRVLFDHYADRWIMAGFGATSNVINIAVSDTANALGPWKSTSFQGLPAGGIADYPTLGMDDKGVYIGTNNFQPNFSGTSLFVIPKVELFDGTPSTTGMTTFNNPIAGANNRGFAIQGAVNWGGNPTNTASVMAADLLSNNQVFYKVNGVNGPGATQTAPSLIGGVGYAFPMPARQPDGTRLVDALDDRISANVAQFNGRLYSVHTVRPTGTDFDVVRWTVVDANTGALIAEGDIGGGGFDYFQGAIAVNEFGEVVIGYNRSGGIDKGVDGRISFMARTYRVDGALGLAQVDVELLLRQSDVDDYRCGSRAVVDPTCRQRWGDYAAVTFDPTDPHNFWAIGEYAADWSVIPGFTTTERAIWHTYIAEITVSASGPGPRPNGLPVPEPTALALLGLGVAMLVSIRRKRSR